MIRRTVSLMLIYIFLLAASPASASIPAQTFRAWLRVADCEATKGPSGAILWHMKGSEYSGALGITNTNWTKYAPSGWPQNAGLASPQQQIEVAMRINKGFPIPDSRGCSGW